MDVRFGDIPGSVGRCAKVYPGWDLVTSMIAQQVTEVVPVADLIPTQMTVGIREESAGVGVSDQAIVQRTT